MIFSFSDKQTERLWRERKAPKLPADIRKRALMRLQRVDAAHKLDDLRVPPSHRLEPLKGDLKGFYSIRINDQWRVVFRFEAGQARDVRITDYH